MVINVLYAGIRYGISINTIRYVVFLRYGGVGGWVGSRLGSIQSNILHLTRKRSVELFADHKVDLHQRQTKLDPVGSD